MDFMDLYKSVLYRIAKPSEPSGPAEAQADRPGVHSQENISQLPSPSQFRFLGRAGKPLPQ